jgi:hypothetical protein
MPLSVEDRFAIQDVVLRYAHFHDSKQTHRVAAEIFAPDAVIDLGTGTLVGHRHGTDGWRVTKCRSLQYGTGTGVGVMLTGWSAQFWSMGRLAEWP